MRSMIRRTLLPTGVLWLAACGAAEPRLAEVEIPVTFYSESDPGEALAGVAVEVSGELVGATDADGRLGATLRRPEGTLVPVSARCPEGHRAAPALPPITVRRFETLEGGTREIRVTVPCPPAERVAAVLVRAGGQADLPILLRGEEVARTDAAGIAHVRVVAPPGTSFRLAIDTTARPELLPHSPGRAFTLGDADELAVLDQPFEVARPRGRRRRAVEPAAPEVPAEPEVVRIERID